MTRPDLLREPIDLPVLGYVIVWAADGGEWGETPLLTMSPAEAREASRISFLGRPHGWCARYDWTPLHPWLGAAK